ncbi:hypothetical protein SMAC4_14031 [Sordaria macrospora]|uniref:uncharacterized protein n=1 Tax=Sordaria macrospora TaxID=5147 RepID=UPI002B2B6D66|nr:hypothetical protein SMAC4_14031 [Sordaria macrospora]
MPPSTGKYSDIAKCQLSPEISNALQRFSIPHTCKFVEAKRELVDKACISRFFLDTPGCPTGSSANIRLRFLIPDYPQRFGSEGFEHRGDTPAGAPEMRKGG